MLVIGDMLTSCNAFYNTKSNLFVMDFVSVHKIRSIDLKKVIFNAVGKVDFHITSILFKALQDLPIRGEIFFSHDFNHDPRYSKSIACFSC